MKFIERNFKKIGSIVGGAMAGLIAGVGTAVPIPILGGAILTGAFPFIAAVVFGAWVGFELHSGLKDIVLYRVVPTAFEVQFLPC